MAHGVRADFPTSSHECALLGQVHDVGTGLVGVGISVPFVVANGSIAEQIQHAPIAKLLHQRQQISIIIGVAVVEGEDNRAARKIS